MNEAIFFLQISLVLLFCWGAYRFGKEGLTAAVALLALIANLFVLKQVSLFGFEVTCSDAFTIGSFLSLNLLREVGGKGAAKRAISLTFFVLLGFALLSMVHLLFRPTDADFAHSAYALLLKPAPRLFLASLTSFYLMQRLEVFLFSWISKRTTLPFTVRSSLTLSATQLLDTLLFSFLGLFGIVAHLMHIIVISYLVKLLAIFFAAPLTLLITRRKIA
ncbi:MAG: hypothetical protein K940chlam2_00805 [Chlamydiae bacterium]|nr:hypothetical protein [Chlamydiota bacterium]